MKRHITLRARGAFGVGALLAAALLLAASPASAQYRRQTLEVRGGWNAIHLEVDPVESSCAALLARHEGKIEAIWTYDNRYAGVRAFDPAEFRDDLETPPVRVENRWRVYHPEHVRASSLHHLRGARAYLLRVRDGEEPFALEVLGRPVTDDGYWVADGYSLRGLLVDAALEGDARPTFAQYFAGSAAHLSEASAVFSMDLDGQMQGPLDLESARVESGRAYWIHTQGVSRYRGPVEIEQAPRRGLDFGLDLVEARLTLRNRTATPILVSLRLLETSTEAPAGEPAWAGDVPLRYLEIGEGVRRWVDLDDIGVDIEVPASGTRRLRLAVDRVGLAPAVVRAADPAADDGGGAGIEDRGARYQGEIEVRTAEGFRQVLAVGAESGDHGGLWTGEVHLRFVRRVQRTAPTGAVPYPDTFRVGSSDGLTIDAALATAGTLPAFPDRTVGGGGDDVPEMSFPLILHVGTTDRTSEESAAIKSLTLLRQVALMWQREGTRVGGAPVDAGYVLMTRDGLRQGHLRENLEDGNPRFVGGTLKDGRRFSYLKTAPTLPRDTELMHLGTNSTFPVPQGVPDVSDVSWHWKAVIDQPALDPLNPFIHRYHPDHGHPKIMRQAGVPAKGGIEVNTTVWLRFDDPLGADPRGGDPSDEGQEEEADPEQEDPAAGGVLVLPERPGYGTKILTGTYREVIEKLTYDAIVVEGSFEIHLVVGGIDELNAGIPSP